MREFLISLLLTPVLLYGQNIPEFVTTLSFKDGRGIVDSIQVGFDKRAGYSMDVLKEFGELDISNVPFKNGFEVRNGSHSNFQKKNIPYTKRKINKFEKCDNTDGIVIFALLIRIKNFPLIMKWNKNQIKSDSCLKTSAITRNSGTLLYNFNESTKRFLTESDSLVITRKYLDESQTGPINFMASLENGTLDTVHVLYLYFSNRNTKGLSTEDFFASSGIDIFPNPVLDNLEINLRGINFPNQLSIFDINGILIKEQLIDTGKDMENIDVSNLRSGMYFLKIKTSYGVQYSEKFIKLE
jgi:hypothetical protein